MPRIPQRTYCRAAALVRGLDPLIAELDAIPLAARRSPMARSLSGRGWRRVEAAHRQLGLPPIPDSIERQMPGELVVGIASVLAHLKTLKPLQTKLTPGVHKRSYPRAQEEE